jgi:transposase
LKTGRAWSIKEVFREFLGSSDRQEGEAHFKLWYQWATRCQLPAVVKVAKMCKAHLGQILNYFDHKISNGPIEGLNSRIQGLTKKAFGYRNRERFKNDIYFHFGGLELYPNP